MREEIRLGNEALGRGDLQEASGHFQALLDKGGTALEERIARNRLKDIEHLERGGEKGKGRAAPQKPPKSKGIKTLKAKKEEEEDEEVGESTRLLLNLKDPLLVKIKRY